MRHMHRLHVIETATWGKEGPTRLCRNCSTQYKDQEPVGGGFTCQQCGHVSRRPLLETPGTRADSNVKPQKQQFIGPRDEDPRLARICGWMDRWETVSSREKWKWGRIGFLWTLLLFGAFMSFSWLTYLGFPSKHEQGDCSEMTDEKEASYSERSFRLRRKAGDRKVGRSEKELEEEVERLQRDEVARLVGEQRQARLMAMRLQGGEEREKGKRGERRGLQQPGGKSKKRGEKENVLECGVKLERKGEQGIKELHQNKGHGGTGIGRPRCTEPHQQAPPPGKGIPHSSLHLQQNVTQHAGIPKKQQQQQKQHPCAPGKPQQQHNATSAKPAGTRHNSCNWKPVVSRRSRKIVPEPAEPTPQSSSTHLSRVHGPCSPPPAEPLEEQSVTETLTTPPCVSPVEPLSPPAPFSPTQQASPPDPSFSLREPVSPARLPASADPVVGHRVLNSPSPPPPVRHQQGSIPALVFSPLRRHDGSKLSESSPCLGAIGQSPMRRSSSNERTNQRDSCNPVQKGADLDCVGVGGESPQSTCSSWDIWDSLQLDSIVDSIYQEPGRENDPPQRVTTSSPACPFSSWGQQGQVSHVWSYVPAGKQPGTRVPSFTQQQEEEAPGVVPMWSYSDCEVGEESLPHWRGEGFMPGALLEGTPQGHVVMGKGSNIPQDWCISHSFGVPDPHAASKAEGMYFAPAYGFTALAFHEPVSTPIRGPLISDGLDPGVPPEFVDCITQEVMVDPVITADGHSYERSSIQAWLRNHHTSPLTGQVLPRVAATPGEVVDKSLRPNLALRSQILEFKERVAKGLRYQGVHEGICA